MLQAVGSLFRNSFFGILTNILNRVGNFVLFVLIVQLLGVEQAGVYTLGVSYFFIGSRFSFWGLDHLLTREVSKNRAAAAVYFSNFAFIRFILSTLTIALFIFIIQLTSYQPETKLVISIMLLSIWPENINNLCWANFAAFEEFHFTSLSVTGGSLVQLTVGLFLLSQGFGLVAMAFIFLANNLMALVINLLVIQSRYIRQWTRPSWAFIRPQLRISWPFVFIGIFFILDNRLDNVILSFVSSEKAIGLYGAASAVIVALGMIPQGYRLAVLPILTRTYQDGTEKLLSFYAKSYKYLLLVGLPIMAATFLLANDLILLIYRQNLPEAVPSLQIMALMLACFFLNVLDNRLLIVVNRQDLLARFLVITTGLNLGINLILSPSLGAVGASIARVVSVIVLFILNAWVLRPYLPGFSGWHYVWRPLIGTFIMSLVIWQTYTWNLWAKTALGSITYLLVLFLLGAFPPNERTMFYQLLKQRLSSKTRKPV